MVSSFSVRPTNDTSGMVSMPMGCRSPSLLPTGSPNKRQQPWPPPRWNRAYSMPITPAPTTTIDDHHHRRRHLVHAEDLVGIDNRFPVELDRRRPRRLGADADDELVAM